MAEMRVIVENEVATSFASTLNTSPFAGDDTLTGIGQATNVLAGQVYAQITNPPAGFYRVDMYRAADGSGTPTLYNNGQIAFGADVRTMLDLPALGVIYHYVFHVNLNGSESIQIRAAVNGSPDITVTGFLLATRIK